MKVDIIILENKKKLKLNKKIHNQNISFRM